MKYRSRTRIVSQILEAANGGRATKSKIMYKTFLSYSQMREYLPILTENDLLIYDGQTHTFQTTEKGLRFIELYDQMDGMLKAVEQQVWMYSRSLTGE